MEPQKREYDAFISYRHNPQDKAIAVQLQKLLERMKRTDPATGRKKPVVVFRDQSELPTSNDLGREIELALENSRFLIMICSRAYQNSLWCMREVEYFRSLHGNTNQYILPILVDGEPDECFPEMICRRARTASHPETGEACTIYERVEPLAADIRAGSLKAMLRKLSRWEYLRIAAPVLGVSFDQLYQRRRREQEKRVFAALAGVLALSIAFGAYNSVMYKRLAREHEAALKADSVNLAFTADILLAEGNRLDALRTILRALPDDTADRPVVQEALKSLSNIMYTYQQPELRVNQVYENYGEIYRFVLARSGRYLVLIDEYQAARCYDLREGREVWQFLLDYYSFQEGECPRLFSIPCHDAVLFIQAEDAELVSLETGQSLWSIAFREEYGIRTSSTNPVLSPDGKYLAVAGEDDFGQPLMYFFDTETGMRMLEAALPAGADPSCLTAASGFSADSRSFTWVLDSETGNPAALYTIDMETGAIVFHASIGGSTVRHMLSDTQYADIFPLQNGGFLYRLKYVRGELDPADAAPQSLAERDRVVRSGTVLSSPDCGFSAGYLDNPRADDVPAPGGTGVYMLEDSVLIIGSGGAVQVDMEGNRIRKGTIRPEVIRCLPEEDGKIPLLLSDGSLGYWNSERMDLDSYDSYRIVDAPCAAASELLNGQIAVLAEADSKTVYSCSVIGNENAQILSLESERITKISLVELGDDRILFLIQGLLQDDPAEAILYDIAQSSVTDRFSIDAIGSRALQGISQAQDLLIIGSAVYDLNTHTLLESQQAPWQEQDLTGTSFLSLDGKILPRGFSSEANTAEALEWWLNGECHPVEMTFEGTPVVNLIVWSMEQFQDNAFLLGDNGLMCAKVGMEKAREENAFPGPGPYSGLLVYCTETEDWRYVKSGVTRYFRQSLQSPYLTFARDHRWIALVEQDGVLRVYDWDTDSYLYAYDYSISSDAVEYMEFLPGDQYLLIRTGSDILIVDVQTGDQKLSQRVTDSVRVDWALSRDYCAHGCYVQGNQLYVISKDERDLGLCIDMDSWEITQTIPGLLYANQTSVFVSNGRGKNLLVYPRWDMDSLITAARTELEGTDAPRP